MKNLRIFVIWLTGKDYLLPKNKQNYIYSNGFYEINSIYCEQYRGHNIWEFRFFSKDNFIISKEKVPNFIHRYLQKLILGFEYKLLLDKIK